jgi:hypothetical protein
MRIRKSYYVAIVVWLLIAILFFIMNKRYNWLTGDDSNLFLGIITVAVSIMSLGLATMQKPSYKGKLAVWNVKESARQVNNNMLVPIGTYSCLTFKIDNYKNEPIESLEVSFRIPEKMYYPERGSHLLLYSFKETIYLKSSVVKFLGNTSGDSDVIFEHFLNLEAWDSNRIIYITISGENITPTTYKIGIDDKERLVESNGKNTLTPKKA